MRENTGRLSNGIGSLLVCALAGCGAEAQKAPEFQPQIQEGSSLEIEIPDEDISLDGKTIEAIPRFNVELEYQKRLSQLRENIQSVASWQDSPQEQEDSRNLGLTFDYDRARTAISTILRKKFPDGTVISPWKDKPGFSFIEDNPDKVLVIKNDTEKDKLLALLRYTVGKQIVVIESLRQESFNMGETPGQIDFITFQVVGYRSCGSEYGIMIDSKAKFIEFRPETEDPIFQDIRYY